MTPLIMITGSNNVEIDDFYRFMSWINEFGSLLKESIFVSCNLETNMSRSSIKVTIRKEDHHIGILEDGIISEISLSEDHNVYSQNTTLQSLMERIRRYVLERVAEFFKKDSITPLMFAKPIGSAPRDGTLIKLLMGQSRDGNPPSINEGDLTWTTGTNSLDLTGVDKWHICDNRYEIESRLNMKEFSIIGWDTF